MWDDTLTPFDICTLERLIGRDPVVMVKARAFETADPKWPAMISTDLLACLRSMTLKERADLRERVKARWQGKH